MIYQRDIATKCKFLLGQWKENLNLTNYERTKFEDTLNQLDFQINKLEKKRTTDISAWQSRSWQIKLIKCIN